MAILVHLYRQLGHASRFGVRWICGCLNLLAGWICEHFYDCARADLNIEYTEMQPRICRWKPLQLGGDTSATLKTLREKIDDLTEIDVCWDPYRDHIVARPIHEVSYYCGLLICFDVVEPYYPDRVLRQFGRVQTIPTMPMIQPLKLSQGKTVQAYKRSVPVTYPWECTRDYMDWFLKITHPYIQIPNLKTTQRRMSRAQDIGNAKLQVVVDKAISLLDKSFLGKSVEDISIVDRNVREMLFNARKEISQEKGQEDRRNKTHDWSYCDSIQCCKNPSKGESPVKGESTGKSTTARASAKTKGPARKKAKN